MKCIMCDANVIDKSGPYIFRSKKIGEISIPDTIYSECESCQKRYLSADSASHVHMYVKMKEDEAIASLPIANFVNASEAIDILGVSKQAFSKNPKIKRGFIYSVQIGSKRLYHKKSVELFKENNDGRFSLVERSVHFTGQQHISCLGEIERGQTCTNRVTQDRASEITRVMRKRNISNETLAELKGCSLDEIIRSLSADSDTPLHSLLDIVELLNRKVSVHLTPIDEGEAVWFRVLEGREKRHIKKQDTLGSLEKFETSELASTKEDSYGYPTAA